MQPMQPRRTRAAPANYHYRVRACFECEALECLSVKRVSGFDWLAKLVGLRSYIHHGLTAPKLAYSDIAITPRGPVNNPDFSG
jgi:hypothetical protein